MRNKDNVILIIGLLFILITYTFSMASAETIKNVLEEPLFINVGDRTLTLEPDMSEQVSEEELGHHNLQLHIELGNVVVGSSKESKSKQKLRTDTLNQISNKKDTQIKTIEGQSSINVTSEIPTQEVSSADDKKETKETTQKRFFKFGSDKK